MDWRPVQGPASLRMTGIGSTLNRIKLTDNGWMENVSVFQCNITSFILQLSEYVLMTRLCWNKKRNSKAKAQVEPWSQSISAIQFCHFKLWNFGHNYGSALFKLFKLKHSFSVWKGIDYRIDFISSCVPSNFSILLKLLQVSPTVGHMKEIYHVFMSARRRLSADLLHCLLFKTLLTVYFEIKYERGNKEDSGNNSGS